LGVLDCACRTDPETHRFPLGLVRDGSTVTPAVSCHLARGADALLTTWLASLATRTGVRPHQGHDADHGRTRQRRERRQSLTTYSPSRPSSGVKTRPPLRRATASTKRARPGSSPSRKKLSAAPTRVIASTSAIVARTVSAVVGHANAG